MAEGRVIETQSLFTVTTSLSRRVPDLQGLPSKIGGVSRSRSCTGISTPFAFQANSFANSDITPIFGSLWEIWTLKNNVLSVACMPIPPRGLLLQNGGGCRSRNCTCFTTTGGFQDLSLAFRVNPPFFYIMEPSVGADPTNNGFADRAVCRFGKMAYNLAGHQRIELWSTLLERVMLPLHQWPKNGGPGWICTNLLNCTPIC